ncbi:MAG: rhodanese-like domain-containing protein [Erythrobacter sp.]
MKKHLLIGGAVALAAIVGIGGTVFWQTSDLERIQAGIEASHEGVAHIAADDFAQLSRSDVILFDVRETEEFEVSHLTGAIQVSPDIGAAEFEERFGKELKGKTAIFYCSVGVRSSILAERVAGLVEQSTGAAPMNLIGGAFQWSNEGRTMVTPKGGETRAIHPYDTYWGRLIDDSTAISDKPAT